MSLGWVLWSSPWCWNEAISRKDQQTHQYWLAKSKWRALLCTLISCGLKSRVNMWTIPWTLAHCQIHFSLLVEMILLRPLTIVVHQYQQPPEGVWHMKHGWFMISQDCILRGRVRELLYKETEGRWRKRRWLHHNCQFTSQKLKLSLIFQPVNLDSHKRQNHDLTVLLHSFLSISVSIRIRYLLLSKHRIDLFVLICIATPACNNTVDL